MSDEASQAVEYAELPAFVKRSIELLAEHFELTAGEGRIEVNFRNGRVSRLFTVKGPVPGSELHDGAQVTLG